MSSLGVVHLLLKPGFRRGFVDVFAAAVQPVAAVYALPNELLLGGSLGSAEEPRKKIEHDLRSLPNVQFNDYVFAEQRPQRFKFASAAVGDENVHLARIAGAAEANVVRFERVQLARRS